MKYLKQRKLELVIRTVFFLLGLRGSIHAGFLLVTENPKMEYWIAIFITVAWLLTCWFTIDMGKSIWKLVKKNIADYEKSQVKGRA